MRKIALLWSAVGGIGMASLTASATARPCYDFPQASQHLNQDVCIRAHVYDVVELADGTRFLDVCSPETTDAACHFTIVSLSQDRRDVGSLEPLRDRQIEIRGTVHSFADRAGIILSNQRQLRGGPEKFRPNPALMKGFSAADSKSAFDDPAFRSGGHHHKSAAGKAE
jgi:hypothetical protein